MGQKKTDGRATQGGITIPAGDYPFGDMFRIGGINGVMLTYISTAETARTSDLEISDAIWYVKVPSAVTVNKGTYLYWTAGAGTKRGDTDLTATPTGSPVAFVEETKNATNYAGVRVLNVGP